MLLSVLRHDMHMCGMTDVDDVEDMDGVDADGGAVDWERSAAVKRTMRSCFSLRGYATI